MLKRFVIAASFISVILHSTAALAISFGTVNVTSPGCAHVYNNVPMGIVVGINTDASGNVTLHGIGFLQYEAGYVTENSLFEEPVTVSAIDFLTSGSALFTDPNFFVNAPNGGSGTWTGSFTPNGFGGTNINVTAAYGSCNLHIIGFVNNIGN